MRIAPFSKETDIGVREVLVGNGEAALMLTKEEVLNLQHVLRYYKIHGTLSTLKPFTHKLLVTLSDVVI